MHKKLIVALAMLSVVAVAPLLSACHTTAGAGQDISATGKAIESTAKKATPRAELVQARRPRRWACASALSL